jgi:ComF family protein
MAFKYNGKKHMAASMAYLMVEAWREAWAEIWQKALAEAWREEWAEAKRDEWAETWRSSAFIGMKWLKPCLVPVPMHPEKEASRGFNQSRLLAQFLSRETGFPMEELLCRPTPGQMQAGLDKNHRREALDQVFQWSGSVKASNRPVIIVDDVVTTGATLESCARALRQQGFHPIWGLTFAGGSREKARNP